MFQNYWCFSSLLSSLNLSMGSMKKIKMKIQGAWNSSARIHFSIFRKIIWYLWCYTQKVRKRWTWLKASFDAYFTAFYDHGICVYVWTIDAISTLTKAFWERPKWLYSSKGLARISYDGEKPLGLSGLHTVQYCNRLLERRTQYLHKVLKLR